MRGLLLTAALFAAAAPAGPGPAREVGVTERLGSAVPLDLVFRDEEGRPVRLGEVIDRPTLLTLNYFTCTSLCTPLLVGLTDALNGLRLEPDKDYRVVTVSFDPLDTPAAAREKRIGYLKQLRRPFPPGAWRFLTGDAPQIEALTSAVGFEYRRQGEQFMHPGIVVVLSPQGRITRYIYGITFLPADLEMSLDYAARGQAQPTVARLLRFCYADDPAGRGKVFKLSRAVGAAVLLLAGGLFATLILAGRRSDDHRG